MNATEILPDSRLNTITTHRGSVNRGGQFWQRIFCASCGADGGLVPEENMTFVFYLCEGPNGCATKYGDIAGMMMMPDEVFYARLNEAQLEKYGRLLSPEEVVLELGDPDSLMSRLARDRSNLTPNSGA